MSKTNKILIFSAVGLLILVALYFVFKSLGGGPAGPAGQGAPSTAQPGPVQSLPDYQLDPDQETAVYEFVKNFAELYNTYSYADYSNLTALGDYETVQMQQKTAELVVSLEKNTQPGYFQEAKIVKDSFKYKYPQAGRLSVTLSLEIKVYSNFFPNIKASDSASGQNPLQKLEGTKKIGFELGLEKYGNRWIVNSIK